MAHIELAADLGLPLEVITRRVGILGMPGMGKTSTAVRIVEQVRGQGVQVAVIDPTGAWWGIAHNAAGDGPGAELVVLGGEHGAAPLSRDAGRACARLVANDGLSCVLDVDRPYFTSWTARQQFVAEFLSELYELCRARILVVIDEAHRFAGQSFGGQRRGSDRDWSAESLSAVNDVVALGRRRGLDAVLVTQRLAKLHKDVLELCGILIAHQLRGNNDRAALRGWLDNAGGEIKEIMAQVGRLDRGRAWVSAPQYDVDGAYLILPKTTFDSSADAAGTTEAPSSHLSEHDTDAIVRLLADTIEQTRADDPRELRGRIAELERLLELARTGDAPAPAFALGAGAAAVLVSIGTDAQRIADQARSLQAGLPTGGAPATAAGTRAAANGERHRRAPARGTPNPSHAAPPGRTPAAQPKPTPAPDDASAGLTAMKQRILDALAWLETARVVPATKLQLAMVVGTHPNTKSFANALGSMRDEDDLVGYLQTGLIALTAAGRRGARWPDKPGTDADLHRMIRKQIGEARWKILAAVIACYPGEVTRAELAELLGVHRNTKTFANGLGSLRTLGLVGYPRRGAISAESRVFIDRALLQRRLRRVLQ